MGAVITAHISQVIGWSDRVRSAWSLGKRGPSELPAQVATIAWLAGASRSGPVRGMQARARAPPASSSRLIQPPSTHLAEQPRRALNGLTLLIRSALHHEVRAPRNERRRHGAGQHTLKPALYDAPAGTAGAPQKTQARAERSRRRRPTAANYAQRPAVSHPPGSAASARRWMRPASSGAPAGSQRCRHGSGRTRLAGRRGPHREHGAQVPRKNGQGGERGSSGWLGARSPCSRASKPATGDNTRTPSA